MQKSLDVTVIGGSTKDIFLISPNFKIKDDRLELVWGEKFVVDKIFTDVGGGGANAAVSFARLGLKAALLSQIGADAFGYEIKEKLLAEGVDSRFLRVKDGVQTSTSALLCGPEGDHSIVMYRGKNDDLKIEDGEMGEVMESKWVYITDLAGESEDLVEEIASFARKKDVKVAFIPGQHQLDRGIRALKKILKNTDCFILNLYEASKLLGGEAEVETYLRQFHSLGAKIVIITQDIRGVNAFGGRRFYHHEAPKVEIVDTTGAGDAFASGFVAGLIKGQSVEEALELGTKNAGSVISQFGAQTGLVKI